MLSYIPGDDQLVTKTTSGYVHLSFTSQVIKKEGNLSKENSASSCLSDATVTTHSSVTPSSNSEKVKSKLLINGAKTHNLKRVSFGSSKGSMVETLIFDSPLQEEPEPNLVPEHVINFPEEQGKKLDGQEKVRVSFFQQSRPQGIDLPDDLVISSDCDFIMATVNVITDSNQYQYHRQESTDSGWDNPFRPGGDLSREADEIVELIKGGKPITPSGGTDLLPTFFDETDSKETHTSQLPVSRTISEPQKKNNNELNSTPNSTTNGNVHNETKSGTVDVQRGTIILQAPTEANQVEHVVIKKKPKCKCCVIQ